MTGDKAATTVSDQMADLVSKLTLANLAARGRLQIFLQPLRVTTETRATIREPKNSTCPPP